MAFRFLNTPLILIENDTEVTKPVPTPTILWYYDSPSQVRQYENSNLDS